MAKDEEAEGEKAYQEGQKLAYDAIKHLTTLSTGSILLLVTFIEKLFKQPAWVGLVTNSLIFFVLSVVASVLAMLVLAHSVLVRGKSSPGEANAGKLLVLGAGLSFLIAIISLVVFAVKNL